MYAKWLIITSIIQVMNRILVNTGLSGYQLQAVFNRNPHKDWEFSDIHIQYGIIVDASIYIQ